MISALAAALSDVRLSFYLDTPIGATINLVSSLVFLLSWARLRVSG